MRKIIFVLCFLSSTGFATSADVGLFNALEPVVGSEPVGDREVLHAANVSCDPFPGNLGESRCKLNSGFEEGEALPPYTFIGDLGDNLAEALTNKLAEILGRRAGSLYVRTISVKAIRCEKILEDERVRMPESVRFSCSWDGLSWEGN